MRKVSLVVGLVVFCCLLTGSYVMACGKGSCSMPMMPSCTEGTETAIVEGTATVKPEKQQTTEIYTCPMHPEVVSNKPGKCPKCGMNLEKKRR